MIAISETVGDGQSIKTAFRPAIADYLRDQNVRFSCMTLPDGRMAAIIPPDADPIKASGIVATVKATKDVAVLMEDFATEKDAPVPVDRKAEYDKYAVDTTMRSLKAATLELLQKASAKLTLAQLEAQATRPSPPQIEIAGEVIGGL